MRKPTPLKLAVVMSGKRQKDIATDADIDEATLSRVVNGLHASDDMRARIAAALDTSVEALWPVAHQPEGTSAAGADGRADDGEMAA